MKLVLIAFALLSSSLYASDTILEKAYNHLEIDKKIIKDGTKFGHRKEALEKLDQRNAEMIELVEQLDIELQKKDEKIAELSREKICTVSLFRQDFVGISTNIEIAKEKAYQECSKKYDLNLQCRRGTVKCN